MEDWKKLSHLPYRKIKELQEKKLRAFIATQLYPNSPYYKKLFAEKGIDPFEIRTLDDLVKIPFTYKEDVAPTDKAPDQHKAFVLRPDEEISKKYGHIVKLSKGQRFIDEKVYEYKPVHLHFTTGRTARPTAFVYSSRDIENLKEAGKRLLDVFGITRDDTVMNIFPYAPHLAFWQTFYACSAMGVISLQTGGGKTMGTAKIISAIESMKATSLVFIPGYAYYLLRMAAEQNRDFSNVKHVALGGERVPPGLKEKLKSLLESMGAKSPQILATYGCTEARVAWGECPSGDPNVSYGYHIYPDMEIIEIVDPETGEVKGEGEEGEIVYTALDWRGTCVLRYRTGDIAKGGIVYEPCPNCGRTVPRVSADIQRKSEFKEFRLTKIKGTLVNMNNFFSLLMGHKDVVEWQVELRKRNNDPYDLDEVYVYITPAKGVDAEALKADLGRLILKETEIAPTEIIISPLQELLTKLGMETELKERRIVDNRPKI